MRVGIPVDGPVRWIAQVDDLVPVDLTNWQARRKFWLAPDDPASAPALDIGTAGSGAPAAQIQLLPVAGGGWQIRETVLAANVETLISAWSRGYSLIQFVPPGGAPPVFVEDGAVTFKRTRW